MGNKKNEIETTVRLKLTIREKIQQIQDEFNNKTGGSISINSVVEKAVELYLKKKNDE